MKYDIYKKDTKINKTQVKLNSRYEGDHAVMQFVENYFRATFSDNMDMSKLRFYAGNPTGGRSYGPNDKAGSVNPARVEEFTPDKAVEKINLGYPVFVQYDNNSNVIPFVKRGSDMYTGPDMAKLDKHERIILDFKPEEFKAEKKPVLTKWDNFWAIFNIKTENRKAYDEYERKRKELRDFDKFNKYRDAEDPAFEEAAVIDEDESFVEEFKRVEALNLNGKMPAAKKQEENYEMAGISNEEIIALGNFRFDEPSDDKKKEDAKVAEEPKEAKAVNEEKKAEEVKEAKPNKKVKKAKKAKSIINEKTVEEKVEKKVEPSLSSNELTELDSRMTRNAVRMSMKKTKIFKTARSYLLKNKNDVDAVVKMLEPQRANTKIKGNFTTREIVEYALTDIETIRAKYRATLKHKADLIKEAKYHTLSKNEYEKLGANEKELFTRKDDEYVDVFYYNKTNKNSSGTLLYYRPYVVTDKKDIPAVEAVLKKVNEKRYNIKKNYLAAAIANQLDKNGTKAHREEVYKTVRLGQTFKDMITSNDRVDELVKIAKNNQMDLVKIYKEGLIKNNEVKAEDAKEVVKADANAHHEGEHKKPVNQEAVSVHMK